MIVRLWRGWTTPAGAAAYERHLRTATFPALEQIEGHEGHQLLRREVGEEVEFVVQTFWRSIAAIQAFAGTDHERAVVPPEAERVLTRFEPRVAHYELAASARRPDLP